MTTRRGMTMIEMMMALSLLAVVALVLVQVFGGTMRVHRDTTAAHDTLGRTQRLGDLLRRDVWGAAAISSDNDALRITPAGGTAIIWRVEDETTLVREAAGDAQRWRMAMPVGLGARGPAVTLRLGHPESGLAATMRFVSQILLAGEER